MFSCLIEVIEIMIPNPDCLVEGYVADEIITSAAGTRVRVGNTDAEGRMAMADAIHHMKQRVTSALLISCRYFHVYSQLNPFAPKPPVTARADPRPFYPL